MKTVVLTRQFSFKGVNLPDPDPTWSVDKVMEFYSNTYPELTNGSYELEDADGDDTEHYKFIVAVGTKG